MSSDGCCDWSVWNFIRLLSMHRLLTWTGQKYDFLSVQCKVNPESHCAPTKVLEKLHIRCCYRFNMIKLPYAGYTIQTEFTRNIRSPDRVYISLRYMYDSQLCNTNLYNGLLLNYVAFVFNNIFPLYFNYGTAVHQKYVYSIYEIYFWFSRDFYVIFYLI